MFTAWNEYRESVVTKVTSMLRRSFQHILAVMFCSSEPVSCKTNLQQLGFKWIRTCMYNKRWQSYRDLITVISMLLAISCFVESSTRKSSQTSSILFHLEMTWVSLSRWNEGSIDTPSIIELLFHPRLLLVETFMFSRREIYSLKYFSMKFCVA